MFRRDFFKKLIIYVGGSIASIGSIILILKNKKTPFPPLPRDVKFFNAEEWYTTEAITSRMIPTDDTPGAKEACIVRFIDRSLSSDYSHQQIAYKKGIIEVNRFSSKIFWKKFIFLSGQNQDYILKKMENGNVPIWDSRYISSKDFFNILIDHTFEGFFSAPKYGGNRNEIGWKLLGIKGDI